MASKMMIRTSASSTIRTLINRHLRPTVAASTNIQKETPVNIYNWLYLLPNNFVPRAGTFGDKFGRDAAGCLAIEEVNRGRRIIEAATENNVEEDSIECDDDFSETDHPVFEDFDEDDDDNDSDDDDPLEINDE